MSLWEKDENQNEQMNQKDEKRWQIEGLCCKTRASSAEETTAALQSIQSE